MSAAGTNSLGGANESLQVTSKSLSKEQPDSAPIPKGYGTVTLPHLVEQPGLVAAAEERGRERRRKRREKKGGFGDMMVDGERLEQRCDDIHVLESY